MIQCQPFDHAIDHKRLIEDQGKHNPLFIPMMQAGDLGVVTAQTPSLPGALFIETLRHNSFYQRQKLSSMLEETAVVGLENLQAIAEIRGWIDERKSTGRHACATRSTMIVDKFGADNLVGPPQIGDRRAPDMHQSRKREQQKYRQAEEEMDLVDKPH